MILVFNGPPGSGKDEACLYFMQRGFKHLSFKYELFKETIKYYGVDEKWFFDGYIDRSKKDIKEEKLEGKTRREALIFVSEEIIKPFYGRDFFGLQLASNIPDNLNVCISDGGFLEELYPIINKVGAENVIIIQLTREGCDFSSDSRRYFNVDILEEFTIDKRTDILKFHILEQKIPLRSYRIHNNGTIDSFKEILNVIYEKEVNDPTNKKIED